MARLSSFAAPRRLFAVAVLIVLLALGGNCLRVQLRIPRFTDYRNLEQKPSTSGPMIVRFLGVTSLLFQDSKTAILSDGFVSRARLGTVLLGEIRPSNKVIDSTMARLQLTNLAAVFCGHSHYDHCLDAPVFAKRLNADLVGSASTYNLGSGYGVPKKHLITVTNGDTIQRGDFLLTFLSSTHSRPNFVPGWITAPLGPPAKQNRWKSGETYSVHIQHRGRTLLVHGSASFVPGALRRCPAEVVYLGIWGLGAQDEQVIDAYWEEVVGATGAQRVILVHWDYFFRSLKDGLRAFPSSLGAFDASMQHVLHRARADGVNVVMPVLWRHTDPFDGLPVPPVGDPGQPLCKPNVP